MLSSGPPASGTASPLASSLFDMGPLSPVSLRSSSPQVSGMASPRSGWRTSRDSLTLTGPYTRSSVEELRRRLATDTADPDQQFAHALHLIDASQHLEDHHEMTRQARKYRESLLHEGMRVIKKLATTPAAPGQPPFAEAQFYLANCYGNGRNGISIDHDKSYHLYVQASKQNHAAATYRTAVCNEVGAGTRRNYELAMRFYRKSASLSDTAGMYKLGLILLHGLLDQPANPREAIVWLRRAASQADEDHPHALYELAMHYEDPAGKVVPHDEVAARNLYTQAAQLGHAPSQCKLGDAFANGTLACPVDARSSISWYTMAANKGMGEAELALSGWFLTGAEGILPQSDTEAYQWARRAAAKGIANAEYAVGHYTEVGIGTRVDFDEAKRWYGKAAAQHHVRATQRLQDWKANHSHSSSGADKECVIM